MHSLANKLAVVSGGCGFVASNLVPALASLGCRVIRVVRKAPVAAGREGPSAEIVDLVGDVSERSTWDRLTEEPDYVFHLAAQTSAYAADLDPSADWRGNALPMLHLLESCRQRNWRPAIVFAGSVTQFGMPERIPVDEHHPDRPVSIYDHHKTVAEAYLKNYVARNLARGATLRLPNLYGPGPASSKADRGILNAMMRQALRGGPLTLYGAGEQLRDYLFVTDAVDAFITAAVNCDAVSGRHFVLGSGQGHTLAQAFQLVATQATRATGRRVEVVTVEPPPGRSIIESRNFVADFSRFCDATQWSPRVTLTDGIDRTLKSMQTLDESVL